MKKSLRLAAILITGLLSAGCAMGPATGEATVLGNQSLEQGEYSAAAEYFETAVSEGEQPVLANRGLGMAYMALGQYDEAADAFETALAAAEKDGKMPETVLDLQKYLASARYRLQEYETTEDICTTILSQEGGICAEAYFLRGASLLAQDLTDEAKQDFDAAAELSPSDYTLFLNIYECYDEENLSGVGSEYLQRALDIRGDTVEDAYHLGRIYYYLGEYEKAQAQLADPVEQKYEDAMYLMGEVYLAQEDYQHAKNIYERIRTEYGDSAQCCNGLALCAIAEEDYDTALEWIAQGLAFEGNTGKQELYFNELVVYERKLDFDTAKQKAAAYIERYPSDERGQKEMKFLQTR
jgi:tetratricopeptide (TPR) repeat protein